MERLTSRLAPPPPAARERLMSARAPGIALALGTLLAILGAAEARAAAVCSNTPGANDWISCTQTGTADIDIDLTNPAISTTNPADEGIWAEHTGTGNIDIDVTGGSIAAADAYGVRARHEAAGAIDIDLTNVDVSTQGQLDNGVSAQHRGTSGTGIDIDVTGGSVTTVGSDSYGIYATVNDGTGAAVGAAISIDTKNTRVSTMGLRGYGVFGSLTTAASTAPLSVNVAGGSVATAGQNAHAVRAYRFSQTGTGAITVGVTDGAALSTTGLNAHGVLITQNGLAGIDADLTDAVISTANTSSYGFMGWLRNNSGSPLLDIDIVRGSVKTTGARSYGILGYIDRNASASALSIDANGVAVSTTGYRSYGVFALSLGTGSVDVDLEDVAISTTGDESYGIVGNIRYAVSTAAIAIEAAGDRAIAVEGLNTAGILGLQAGRGSVRVTTGAETSIEAPFAVGIEGRTTNDAGAAGRIVVTHGGAAEARYAGVVALAARSSGHTMGDGAQTADDAARTEAMIAVTSSGTVTVGAPVMDAFIRARIAGADETLSAAEQAVLSAITSGASDASDDLDTALAALPAAYDDDWKAEARNLLRKRIAEPDAARAANRAAEEILGLSRAGVRAVALSHTGMATFIRQGDRDPAILAIAAASRTEQQQEALAEQEKLSAAERTVLEAALTGSGLETALAALAGAAYTDDWKDGVRQRAASYNAGDVQVDVTGGAITAEGNGVEALYAVPHERNGAITVSVAEGARVTGGANGIYVRGGGAGEGDLRAQSVTVNGQVTGGTGAGAGVRMIDGGRLTVGRTGRIGATSGVGVLSDGAGDLHATVAGTVEGDVQVQGGGTLTLNLREGGAVTGTVHDPAGLPTVVGSIGRLLYTSGATVTVASTGKLTGVEVDGGIEALRAEAGDLDVTVAGRVAGDLRAPSGGTLTLNLREGGAVTGTVHDPAGLPTVVGSIGRLLYTNGATVTVAQTGALTGVEVDGRTEALRSEAGDLDLTVAGMVTGDVFGLGAGEHTVTVSDGGTVTGTVDLAASTVRVDGRAGRVRFDEGGTVTVGSSGWITGIEGVAIRNAAGDLVVSVAGRITGDVIDLGPRPAKITTEPDSTVAGNIDMAAAGSEVRVGGTVEKRIRFRRGGMVTVGRDGKVEGWVSRDEGELVAVIERKPEETTKAAARKRAFPGGIDLPDDEILLKPELADHEPRRVYEALPSVLLGAERPAGVPGADGCAAFGEGSGLGSRGDVPRQVAGGCVGLAGGSGGGAEVPASPPRPPGGMGHGPGRRRSARRLPASPPRLGDGDGARRHQAARHGRGGVWHVDAGGGLRRPAGRGDGVRGRPQRVAPRGAEGGRVGLWPCAGGGSRSARARGAAAGGPGAHASGGSGAFEGVDGRFHRRGGFAGVDGRRAKPEGSCGRGCGDETGRTPARPGVRLSGGGTRVLERQQGHGVGDGTEVGSRRDMAPPGPERGAQLGRRPVHGAGRGELRDEWRQPRGRRRAEPERAVLIDRPLPPHPDGGVVADGGGPPGRAGGPDGGSAHHRRGAADVSGTPSIRPRSEGYAG